MESTSTEERLVLVPRSFRVEPSMWERFDNVSRAHNRDRAGHLRHLIREAVREYESPS